MRKLPKPQTGGTAVSIEAVRRNLDAANTPREVRDVAQLVQLARKWAKHQGYALDQQIAWGSCGTTRWENSGKSWSRC
jgi:hypothetical protein